MMKRTKMKAFLMTLLALSIGIGISKSQMIGGSGTGQSSPKSVQAANVSAGGVSGDVNLFTGTFATGYHLGTVSTPSGIAFSLSLSHSSSYAVGTDAPFSSGIPYGEGWNLDVPRISVSTVDFDKYTAEAAYRMVQSHGTNSPIDKTFFDYEAQVQGDLFWYAPSVTIPGYGGGRLVFKKFNNSGAAIFVPRTFEKYFEVHYEDGVWFAYMEDGTIFEFSIVHLANRNPEAQPVTQQITELNYSNGGTNGADAAVIANQATPKTEVLAWYVRRITNSNLPGVITFAYETFGKADYHQEFDQGAIDQSIDARLYPGGNKHLPETYSDIFLTEVNSFYEKIELDYSSITPYQKAYNLLELNDPEVFRKDSLYSTKVVYEWGATASGGVTNSSTIPLPPGNVGQGIHANFDGFGRYKHGRDGEVPGYQSDDLSPTNPYVKVVQGLAAQGTGLNYSGHYSKQEVGPVSSAHFNHGFLESPRIGHDLPEGDLYEVQAVIEADNLAFCNFDINVVTGEKQNIPQRYVNNLQTTEIFPINMDGTVFPPSNGASVGTTDADLTDGFRFLVKDYHDIPRSTPLFSSFSNPIKWNLVGSNSGGYQITTSNFFLLPSLNDANYGFSIQVGPGNTDMIFDRDECFMRFGDAACGTFGNADPIVKHAYIGMFGSTTHLQTRSIPQNFGTGMPWRMVSSLYDYVGMDPFNTNGTNVAHPFWYNRYANVSGVGFPNWPNSPTLAGGSVRLANLKLVRHAKNPYMLCKVRQYKRNGSTNAPNGGYQLVSELALDYDVEVVQSPAVWMEKTAQGTWVTVSEPSIPGTTNTSRNVFLLKAIQSLPIDGTVAAQPPTTHFEYTTIAHTQTVSVEQMGPNVNAGAGLVNVQYQRNIPAITKITNQLGGETLIEYDETAAYEVLSAADKMNGAYWADLANAQDVGGIQPHRKKPASAATRYLVVKKKTQLDAGGQTRVWDYSFESLQSIDRLVPFTSNFIQNDQFNRESGFERALVYGPELTSGNRPLNKYYHNTSDLLWGKLTKAEVFDGNQVLISKTETDYTAQLAFESGFLRDFASCTQLGYDYCDYTSGVGNSPLTPSPAFTFNAPTVGYNSDPTAWELYWLNVANYMIGAAVNNVATDNAISLKGAMAGEYEAPRFYEGTFTAYIAHEAPTYLNSYFVKATQTRESTFDNFCAETAPGPGGAGARAAGNLAQGEMQTIKEFEYFDATEKGRSTTSGYKELFGDDPAFFDSSTGEAILYNEPSWQLHSVKTYSPQLPGHHTLEEYYYYYDLVNHPNNQPDNMVSGTQRYTEPHSLAGSDGRHSLFLMHDKGLRSIAFEHRSTSVNPSETHTSSQYFEYDTEWGEFDDYVLEIDPTEPAGCNVPPTTGGGTNPPAGGVVIPTDLSNLIQGYYPNGNGINIAGIQAKVAAGMDNGLLAQNVHGPLADALWNHLIENGLEPGFYDFTDRDGDGTWTREELQQPEVVALRSLYTQTVSDPTAANDHVTNSLPALQVTNGDVLAAFTDPMPQNGGPVYAPNMVFPNQVLKVYHVEKRNNYHNVEIEADAAQLKTRYSFNRPIKNGYKVCDPDNPGSWVMAYYYTYNQVGIPTAVEVGYTEPNALITSYVYNNNLSILSVTQPTGEVLSYKYDAYNRMKSTAFNGDKITEVDYHNWENNFGQSFENRALENWVETTLHNDVSGSNFQKSRAYIDPLGRKWLSEAWSSVNAVNRIVSGSVDRDRWDRPVKAYAPYGRDATTSTLQYDFHTTFTAAQPYVWVATAYEDGPRSRPVKHAKPGEDILTGKTVNSAYCTINGTDLIADLNLNLVEQALFHNPTASHLYRYTSTIDEDNKIMVNYTDAWGKKVATRHHDGTQDIITLFAYDARGNLNAVINPEKQISGYQFNFLGQLFQKSTVDGGTTRYVYDERGAMVALQDADNAAANQYRLSTYDRFQRPTGQYLETVTAGEPNPFGSFNAEASLAWENAAYQPNAILASTVPEKKMFYNGDQASVSALAMSNVDLYLSTSLENVLGRMTASVSYNLDGKPVELRFFSYNDRGEMKWEIGQFNPNGITAQAPGISYRLDYKDYDLQGKLQTMNVDLDGDNRLDFQYHYTYDEFSRLKEVFANYDNDKAYGFKVADYEYDNVRGNLSTITFYDSHDQSCKNVVVDKMTYTYDVRNRMTQMWSETFRWRLYYDSDQPAHVASYGNNYNGNVNATEGWYRFNNLPNGGTVSNASSISNFDGETIYAYEYDGLNRLTKADASVLPYAQASGNAQPVPAAMLTGDVNYSFDKIGNLTALSRQLTSLETEDYLYNYQAGTNRLMSIDATLTTVTGIGTSTVQQNTHAYTYSNNGNLTTDSKRNIAAATYGRANLPAVLQVNNNQIKYGYNTTDQRIYKVETDEGGGVSGSEYYLKNAAGQDLAVFDMNSNKLTWYIFGGERLAKTGHQLSAPDDPDGAFGIVDFSDSERTDENSGENNKKRMALEKMTSKDGQGEVSGLNLPDALLYVELTDGTRTYVIQSQLSEVTDIAQIISTIDLLHPDQQIAMQDAEGLDILISLDELFDLTGDQLTTLTLDYADPYDAPYDLAANIPAPDLVYYIKDHLGNTRVTHKTDVSAYCGPEPHITYTVENVMDYYPYGKILREYSLVQEKYLTTNHERDVETGLDYRGARFYDADVARFLSLDPLAADFPSWSDYNYVMGNPVYFTDPDGRSPDAMGDGDGEIRYVVSQVVDDYTYVIQVHHKRTTTVSYNDDGSVKEVTVVETTSYVINQISSKGVVIGDQSDVITTHATVTVNADGEEISRDGSITRTARENSNEDFTYLDEVTQELADFASVNGEHFVKDYFDKVKNTLVVSELGFRLPNAFGASLPGSQALSFIVGQMPEEILFNSIEFFNSGKVVYDSRSVKKSYEDRVDEATENYNPVVKGAFRKMRQLIDGVGNAMQFDELNSLQRELRDN